MTDEETLACQLQISFLQGIPTRKVGRMKENFQVTGPLDPQIQYSDGRLPALVAATSKSDES
jgi:hypothetical protein